MQLCSVVLHGRLFVIHYIYIQNERSVRYKRKFCDRYDEHKNVTLVVQNDMVQNGKFQLYVIASFCNRRFQYMNMFVCLCRHISFQSDIYAKACYKLASHFSRFRRNETKFRCISSMMQPTTKTHTHTSTGQPTIPLNI